MCVLWWLSRSLRLESKPQMKWWIHLVDAVVGMRIQCWDMRVQGLQGRVSWAYCAQCCNILFHQCIMKSGISLIAMKLWSTCINVAQWTVMNNDCWALCCSLSCQMLVPCNAWWDKIMIEAMLFHWIQIIGFMDLSLEFNSWDRVA